MPERPRNEFLLPAREHDAIAALMVAWPKLSEADTKRLHEYDRRISDVIAAEARAEAARNGVKSDPPRRHVSHVEVLEFVRLERRAWEYSLSLEGKVSCDGLGQFFGECEDEVPGAIVALMVLGVEKWAREIAIMAQLICGPESVPEALRGGTEKFDQSRWRTLEQEMWDNHLMPVRMRHALKHRELFFAD